MMPNNLLQFREFHDRVAAGERPSAGVYFQAKFAALQSSDPQVVSFIFSDNSVDSFGDTIDAKGWEFDRTGAGTIALFGHDASTVENVMGRAHNVRVSGNQLIGDIHFAPKEVNPQADVVRQLVKGGFLDHVSVGFQPLEWKAAKDKNRPGGIDFTRQKLLEISIVPLAANDNAVALARRAGIEVDRVAKSFTRPSTPTDISTRRQTAATVKAEARGEIGGEFSSLGEQIKAMLVASERGGIVDSRLVRAPVGANEADPSAAGFLVQTNYATELLGLAYDESVLAPLCRQWKTSNPLAEVSVPGIDEISRANGSRAGGLTSWWSAESDQVPGSYPKFKNLTFATRKLLGLTVLTNELMKDALLFDYWIKRAFAMEFGFKVDLAIFSGSGAGQPQGVINAPATIVVPKQPGQAAATLVAENVTSMWTRLLPASRRTAVWLINDGAEEQLGAFAGPAALQYALPGVETDVFATLKGRPVIPIEAASVLGTVGDIALVDLSHYILVTGGLTPAISAHFKFDSDTATMRFALRIDGKPEFGSPVTTFNGAGTRSPFVTLAAR